MKILDFQTSKNLLSKYNIPFCRSELVGTKEEAIEVAQKIGYPVVLKISSPDIIHKTEIGGVKAQIGNSAELSLSWDEIMNSVKSVTSNIDGMLVQNKVLGNKVVIGMKRDPQFGPVIMFGLGGIFIEIIKDVTFRVAPVSEGEAIKMIKEIRGYPILEGARTNKPSNIKKIAEIIAALSKFSLAEEKIKEIDLNPVIADKEQALVVDARFLIDE